MHHKAAAATAALVAAIGVPAAPALARTHKQQDAAITKALSDSSAALQKAAAALAQAGDVDTTESATAQSLQSLSGTVSQQGTSLGAVISSVNQLTSSMSSLNSGANSLSGALTGGLTSVNNALTAAVNTLDGSLSTLQSGLTTVTSGLSTLSSEVNDPNTGLGEVDDGVADLIVTPAGGSPIGEPPLFAPNLSLAPGTGSTVSGTFPVQCAAATCTLSLYAQDNSNKPQPAGGDVAADVGASVTVTAINPAASPDNETFQDAGVTPDNAAIGNSPVVAIPTRTALSEPYPAPGLAGAVQVPLQSILTQSGTTLTVPGGLYLVSASVSFLKVTSS